MPELTVQPLPDTVAGEFAAAEFDGSSPPWTPDAADGKTLFDTPQSEDGTLTVVFPQDKFDLWRSQALARVESADGRTYLAQVVRGPYAAPIGLPAAAPALVITQVEGSLFTPPYHGWASLQILGETVDGQTTLPLFRPRPNSAVKLLTPDETRAALKCDGDLRLGNAVGLPDLPVGLRSDEKAHVPRHTLAVGTTGAGKSTFIAGWVEKLSKAGFNVILIDVEGEYASIHQPAESVNILPTLKARGLTPAGVDNTFLLVPTDAEPADPDHPKVRRFCLDFANISPHIAAELLQANDAQTERFQVAYDAAGELVTELVPAGDRDDLNRRVREWDDQEGGHPGLKLGHVLDMAQAIAGRLLKEELTDRYLHADGFKFQLDRLAAKAAEKADRRKGDSVSSWRKTIRLISTLHKTGLFDRDGTKAADGQKITRLDYAAMLEKPGRVLVYDLSGLDAPPHRNLAISDLLRGVMDAQDRLYAAAPAGAKPKTVVIVEEAHEFVSGERIAQMPALFGQLQKIARRGRKRWLGLMFATQFPQHLPGELFTLCNNRVLMRLGDEPTLRRLQHSVGGVPENLWPRLKNLPTGQAIVSAHGIEPALVVNLEPGRCRLRMVD